MVAWRNILSPSGKETALAIKFRGILGNQKKKKKNFLYGVLLT